MQNQAALPWPCYLVGIPGAPEAAGHSLGGHACWKLFGASQQSETKLKINFPKKCLTCD